MKKPAIGDSVQIKKNVFEPYEGNFDLSDWQGRILQIYNEECDECGHKSRYVSIGYDSITLMQMPEEYILGMIGSGFDFAETDLSIKEVIPVSPRDTVEETAAVRMELNKKYDWED